MAVLFSTEHLAKKIGKSNRRPKDRAKQAHPMTPLWDKHREHLKTLTLGVDIAFLHNSPEWAAATAVLEIGTGKTAFLEHLIDYFPEKEYVSLKLTSNDAPTTETSERPGTISSVAMNVEAVDSIAPDHLGRYDIIFLHSMSREIASPRAFIQGAFRLLKPGGTLIIYELNDERIAFRPDAGFSVFFEELPALRIATSEHRCDWNDLLRAGYAAGFSVKACRDVLFPTSYGDNKRHLTKIVSQLLDLAEQSGVIEWNFASARRALQRWSSDSSAFGQFAVRRIQLKRPGGWLRKLWSFIFG